MAKVRQGDGPKCTTGVAGLHSRLSLSCGGQSREGNAKQYKQVSGFSCPIWYARPQFRYPAVVLCHKTQLPDKQMLAAKLHEFYALNAQPAEAKPAPVAAVPAQRKKKGGST